MNNIASIIQETTQSFMKTYNSWCSTIDEFALLYCYILVGVIKIKIKTRENWGKITYLESDKVARLNTI